MAKAKFKLGTFIKFTHGGTEYSGDVEGIVTRAEGYGYFVKGWEGAEVPEHNVLSAYRELKPRATSTKKAKTASKPKQKNVAKDEAQASH